MGLSDNIIPQYNGIKIDKTKKLISNSIGGKFMIMERISDSEENLNNVSPFLIKKVIDNVCSSEVEICKKLRNGTILIKTKTLLQAQKLYQLISLSSCIHVTVSEHKTLNVTKGVIYCNDLREMKEEEILEELKNQNIIKVEKILKRVEEKLLETGLIILTFDSLSLPDYVMVGYEKIRVKVYIPRPMRCSNCCQYGHSRNFCTNTKTCGICSDSFHTNTELGEKCLKSKLCVNCKLHNVYPQNHSIFEKSCPVFLKEKEIQAIITLEKTNRNSAIAIYNQRNPNNRITYAKTASAAVSTAVSSISLNKVSTTISDASSSKNTRPLIDYNDLLCSKINSLTSTKGKSNKTVTILPRKASARTRSKIKKLSALSDITKTNDNTSDVSSEGNFGLDEDIMN